MRIKSSKRRIHKATFIKKVKLLLGADQFSTVTNEFFITKQPSLYERRMAAIFGLHEQQQHIKFSIDQEFMKFASRQPLECFVR